MIWRLLSAIGVTWALGFVAFAVTLPKPLPLGQHDIVVVPTGGAGRIARGLEILDAGYAKELFVSGVDPEVRKNEFAAEFGVTDAQMACCVTLGYMAVDTQGNASEAANWIVAKDYKTVRLVTSDWHMRRTFAEFRKAIPASITIEQDAIAAHPSFAILVLEYHKFLLSRLAHFVGLAR